MAGQQRTIGVHDAPPGNAATPEGHNAAHLPGTAVTEYLGHVAIGQDAPWRYRVDNVEHAAGIVIERRIAAAARHARAGRRGPAV
jgi:hypothetical protein